jgi:hypothetical protein
MKLGDAVSKIATPIASALNLDCIDPATKILRADSPCAKRRDLLNRFSDSLWDLFFPTTKGGKMKQFMVQLMIAVEAEKAEEVLPKVMPKAGEIVGYSVNPRTPQPQQGSPPTRLAGSPAAVVKP